MKKIAAIVTAAFILLSNHTIFAEESNLNLQEFLKNVEKESKWLLESIDPENRDEMYQISAGVLAEWIKLSKQSAVDSGVKPIPERIKNKLRPFFSESLLDSVRYRTGDPSAYSLSSLSFQYGDTGAITLDNVVVFYNSTNAADVSLWAHELQHVHQYRKWGLTKFARNYLQNWREIEHEAEQASRYYTQHAGR